MGALVMSEHDPDDAAAGDDPIGALIGRQTGLRLLAQQTKTMHGWITERIRALGLADLGSYEHLLRQESTGARAERRLLAKQLTTGESYFFRDAGQIDLLARTLLPALIAKRASRRRLRLWSAGCSTGEEAYTLAMLISELGSELAGWSVEIIATDINLDALEKARRGVYGAWSFRTMDPDRVARHFEQRGGLWQIDARLRDMVTFRALDLVRETFPNADNGLDDFDLILCRNVFIYLNQVAIGTIARKFAAALREGGCLMTGHSELFAHDTAPLRVHMYPQSAVYSFPPAAQEPPEPPARPRVRPQAAVAVRVPRQVRLPARPPVQAKAASRPIVDADALIKAAWRYADAGGRAEAIRICEIVKAAAPFDARAYLLLAHLGLEQGQRDDAKALLHKAVYLDPQLIAAYLELASIHGQEGDGPAARRTLRSARAVLVLLPPTSLIAPYETSTAEQVLAYVDRMLAAKEGGAA